MEKQDKKERIADYKQRTVTGGVIAVKHTTTGKRLIMAATDLASMKNRFEFAQKNGSCFFHKLDEDWRCDGPSAFTFEVLESLEKKDTQSDPDFKADVETLKVLWLEKLAGEALY